MPTTDTLNVLLSYLHEAGPYVLASPEDAEYFRKRKTQNAKRKTEEEVLQEKRKTQNAECKTEKEVLLPQQEKRKTQNAECKTEEKPLSPSPTVPQPAPALPPPPSHSLRNLLSVVAPELAILNDIPSDAIARKIAERWKTKNQTAPISILLYQEPPEQRALLEQIAKALDIYFGPAKIVNAEKVEKDKQWEAFLSVADLKIVIVCDYTLWQLNHLMHFYKETPAQGTRTLGNTPLFLLPDLSLYLKDPLLKRSLWKALCQKFS